MLLLYKMVHLFIFYSPLNIAGNFAHTQNDSFKQTNKKQFWSLDPTISGDRSWLLLAKIMLHFSMGSAVWLQELSEAFQETWSLIYYAARNQTDAFHRHKACPVSGVHM